MDDEIELTRDDILRAREDFGFFRVTIDAAGSRITTALERDPRRILAAARGPRRASIQRALTRALVSQGRFPPHWMSDGLPEHVVVYMLRADGTLWCRREWPAN